MPSQHKRPPIAVRLPEDDESWVRAHAAATGQAVNAVIVRAVALLRDLAANAQ